MELLNNEKGENPIEVGLYLIMVLLVMSFLMFTTGAFLDTFIDLISGINISLSTWGQTMMGNYMEYATYAYLIPSIFIIIVMLWGIKSIIKRHPYSATDQQYINYQEEF